MTSSNFLEEKQLDFNQPILSVRKLPSEFPTRERETKGEPSPPLLVAPSHHKPEMKSGPLTNPGTVPFVWEQSPGRPKDGRESEYLFHQHPPMDSKVPPGSLLYAARSALLKRSNQNKTAQDEDSSLLSDSDIDVFVDALATPSRSDSFFLNCSISGLSELDGPEGEPFGSSTMDLQTRDFMIGRFLPAAEAMASESPQFSSRKPPVPRKQFSSISDSETDVPLIHTAGTDSVQNIPRNDGIIHNVHGLQVEESDDEENDSDGQSNSSSKACGLLPRFCFQNSICLLSPVPGMKHSSLLRSTKRSSNDLKQSTDRLRKRSHGSAPFRRASNQSSNGLPEVFEVQESSSSCRDSVTSFRDLLAMEKLEWELDSANSAIEKTVYMDSVKDQSSGSISTETGLPTEIDQSENGAAVSIDSSVDSSVTDVKHISGEELIILSKGSDSQNSCSQSESPIDNETAKSHEQIGIDSKLTNEQHCMVLPPPLPKSPSESWLQRTLPVVSLKSSSSRSSGGFGRIPVVRPSN